MATLVGTNAYGGLGHTVLGRIIERMFRHIEIIGCQNEPFIDKVFSNEAPASLRSSKTFLS